MLAKMLMGAGAQRTQGMGFYFCGGFKGLGGGLIRDT